MHKIFFQQFDNFSQNNNLDSPGFEKIFYTSLRVIESLYPYGNVFSWFQIRAFLLTLHEPPRGKPRGIKPYRFLSALKVIREIRLICEISGLIIKSCGNDDLKGCIRQTTNYRSRTFNAKIRGPMGCEQIFTD